jgi:hypothetical protein
MKWDAFQLIDAVTGGHHDLGTADDFARDYFYRQGGKVIAMNESKMDELGKKMSRYIQFRDGYSDNNTYLDQKTGQRKKVSFPTVAGDNRSYGQLSHVTPFEVHSTVRKDRSGKTLKGEDGKTLHRQVFVPQPDNDSQRRLYDRYKQLEAESLSEAERQNLDDLSESGVNSGSQNYLQGIQKLQQFLNAPLSEQAYWEPIKNGRGETIGKRHIFERDPKTGHKLYYKAKLDDNGKVIGYEKDAHGKPVLLPPVHHDNPKAEALRKTVMDYLAEHEAENRRRIEQNKGLAPGEVPMPTGDAFPPKVVITSNFTTFGTDVVEAVLRDIQRDHGWNYGKFTGDQDNDREHDKVAFGQDPKTAFMVISDAGKEGIGLGNAHMLIHFDQDFNPNLMPKSPPGLYAPTLGCMPSATSGPMPLRSSV